jgi:hypothetical protein
LPLRGSVGSSSSLFFLLIFHNSYIILKYCFFSLLFEFFFIHISYKL